MVNTSCYFCLTCLGLVYKKCASATEFRGSVQYGIRGTLLNMLKLLSSWGYVLYATVGASPSSVFESMTMAVGMAWPGPCAVAEGGLAMAFDMPVPLPWPWMRPDLTA